MDAERDEKLKYKNHSCKTCGKSFFVRSKLIIHERVHTAEKPYSCDICEKKFSDSSNLTKHKKIHTGGRPYECEICEKTFNKFNNLVQHKRIHTGEKPYECDICQKYFTASSGLYKHNKTPVHLNKKKYMEENSSSNLNRFIDCGELIKVEIKEEERVEPVQQKKECETCKKTFNTNRSLADHRRIHTGEKPYECDICKESFSRTSNLHQHNKTLAHLKRKQAIEENSSPHSDMFIDCGELIRVEIKEEVRDEEFGDSISIQKEERLTSNLDDSVTCDSTNPNDITEDNSDKHNINKVNNFLDYVEDDLDS